MRYARIPLLVPLLLTSAVFAGGHTTADAPASPTPDQAYRLLLDGHTRYATNARTLPHQDENRRCETTTNGQHPVAAVLSCADSRVPPELLFDQGIGDLFVIRVAGNVAATDELGTLEYGVEHLNIPLIVVLGHSRCGAVTAVVDGAHAEGNLAELLKPIGPAATRAKHDQPTLRGPALLSVAIRENVRQAISDLTTRSPALARAAEAGRVKIVGGVYDIHAGRIDWLDRTALAAAEPMPGERIPASHAHRTPADPHAADAHASHADTHAAPTLAAKAVVGHAHPAPVGHAPAAVHSAPAHPSAAAPHDAHAPAAAEPQKTTAIEPIASRTPSAEAKAVTTSLADQWPVLAGAVIASTLIGAGVTHVASRAKQHA